MSAGSASTTMGAVDGDAYCAQFDTLEGCLGGSGADATCEWRDIATYDATCSEQAATSVCLWIPQPGTDPGCGGFPLACPGEAFFREVAGGVEVSYECGGSYPSGFEPCPAMNADEYAMPECNCGCTEGEGSSSTSGGTSSSTG